MADTYAVHHHLGRDATAKRLARWAEFEGEEAPPADVRPVDWVEEKRLGPAMRRSLLHLNGTAVDVVRDVFQQARFTRKRLDAARVVFEESGMPYPAEVETMIGELTERFNSINEEQEIADIRCRIVKACKAPEQGAALAEELERVIQTVRAKDRVAANIALLAQAFDGAMAHQEAEHAKKAARLSDAQEHHLWLAMRSWASGTLREHLQEDSNAVAVLSSLLEVSASNLEESLTAYFERAEKTQDVAEQI